MDSTLTAVLPAQGFKTTEARRLPTWVWALALLIALLTLLVSLPANWLAWWLLQQSDGRIVLADARGTVWQGSAVLGFKNEGSELSLPGRLQWQLHLPTGLSLPIRLQHEGVLEQPVELLLAATQLQIAAGAANFPLGLATLIGAPLNTLRLQGNARLQWSELHLSYLNQMNAANGSTRLTDVSSAINAGIATIRPLGTYRIEVQTTQDQKIQWQVVTEQGPLQLRGDGRYEAGGIGFTGTASLAPDTSALTRIRLQPLLNVLGRRKPDGVGNSSSDVVNIQIGSS